MMYNVFYNKARKGRKFFQTQAGMMLVTIKTENPGMHIK